MKHLGIQNPKVREAGMGLQDIHPAADRESNRIEDLASRAERRSTADARSALDIPYRTLFQESPDAILIIGMDGSVIECNDAAYRQFGYSKDEVSKLNIRDMDRFTSAQDLEGVLRKVLEEGRAVFEAQHVGTEGGVRYVHVVSQLLDLGGSMAFYTILRDITERGMREEKLKLAATRDRLTGIYNRAAFEEILQSEMTRARRYGILLALIIFDLDYFKFINDLHGHQAGDYVLRKVSGIIQSNIRSTDSFARWGGDEFMVLSQQTTVTNAIAFADRIRTLVEHHSFGHIGKVSITCGLSRMEGDESVHDLVRRADNALYAAKKKRNCVKIA